MPRVRVHAFEHTGDVGFELEAPDLEGLFEGARRAVLAQLLRRPPHVGADHLRLSLEAPGPDRLLLRWLDELLFLVQTHASVPISAALTLHPPAGGNGGWRLVAEVALAPLDPQAHGWRGEVKAATYHGLELTRDGRAWRARVVLDV
jgi:SHS2 domain-containing protein